MRKSEMKKRLKEQARKNFAHMHKVGEYDENGINTKAFITFINRYGFYIIDNMVGDSFSEKYQQEIDQLKIMVENSDKTDTIFETVTESFEDVITKSQSVKRKYKIKSNSIFNDRKILTLGDGIVNEAGNCSIIHNCFKDNFQHIIKILRSVTEQSQYEELWDLSKVHYSIIMSDENSTMQQLHFDYEGNWERFDDLEKNTGVTTLSLLHFPEGGCLVVYPCESSTAKAYRERRFKMKKNKKFKGGNLKRNKRHSAFDFGNLGRITYSNGSVKASILKLGKNQTVVFRGIYFFLLKYF